MILFFYLDQSLLRYIFQQQITDLILINDDKYNMMESTQDYTINVYSHILNFFKNLKHFNIIERFSRLYPYLSLRDSPSTTFSSSTLTHLCINVMSLDDCLYLLDGRLKQLTTLIVRINYIDDSSSIIHSMVSLTNDFDHEIRLKQKYQFDDKIKESVMCVVRI
jgi:hypothetical protein